MVYTEKDHAAVNVWKHTSAILLSCSSLDEDTVVFRSPDGADSFALKISSFTANPREVTM